MENAQKELSLSSGTPTKTIILRGDLALETCKLAWEVNFDLIVMGRWGLTEIKEYLLDSVSMRVIRRTRCPVLVVR